MPRRLIGCLLVWLALGAPAFAQSNGSLLGLNVGAPPIASGSTYIGPGDVVSGATAWYGLRAYNAAYAATPGKSVNVRRAPDNVNCDVNVATTGGLGLTTATCNSSTQGGITPTAFAGTDATATCTLASTTATCASASSTPHVGSTVVGASLTQPCLITAVGTFTGGAGTFTTSLAGTSTSCGAIGSGETFTMTYGLYVTEAYDQTGNGNHALQATAGSQPQFLPVAAGALPTLLFVGASSQQLKTSATVGTLSVPYSFSSVAERTSVFTTFGDQIASATNSESFAFNAVASQVANFAGSNFVVSASDSVLHAFQVVTATGSTADINVDGTRTTGTSGTSAFAGALCIGGFCASSGRYLSGYLEEVGAWPVGFTSGNETSVCRNQQSYIGAGNFGATC